MNNITNNEQYKQYQNNILNKYTQYCKQYDEQYRNNNLETIQKTMQTIYIK